MKASKSYPFWQRVILWSAGGINIVILVILLSIWRTGDRTLNFIGNMFKFQPVQPRIESSSTVVQQIRNIQELTTTVQTMETIMPTSADRKLGEISLATTRLLYIARGEIRAGVDLSQLTDSNIKINNNSIEIDLPPAKILNSKIDVNNSRVYDYDRGFLNLGPDVAPQLQTLAQRKTLTEIINTACDEGILTTANERAKTSITQLLNSTNSNQKVKVNTTLPDSCGSNR